MKYAINGRFIVRKQTGQERFATELVSELDKISEKGEYIIVIPEYAQKLPNYKNIEIVKYGNVKSHMWEQVNFYWYIRKHKLTGINLCTTCPLLKPDILCMHDACIFEITDLLTQNLYGKLSTAWHKMMFYAGALWAKKVLTVSEYSKSKLMKYLKLPSEKVFVVYNAWQHFNRVEVDNRILAKLPKNVIVGEYYMALSSLTPMKNFIWIKEVAQRNPDKPFVVTGSAEGFTKLGEKELKNENIYFTGYLNDGEIKSLMENCKAFIHPAIYEGFGIPPLEAMSCGADLIISTATCLPEIYEKSAHYIDPYNYDVDLDEILKEKIESSEKILNKFSWANEAKKLHDMLRSL